VTRTARGTEDTPQTASQGQTHGTAGG